MSLEFIVMKKDKDMKNRDIEKFATHLVEQVRDACLKNGKKNLSDNRPEAETVKE